MPFSVDRQKQAKAVLQGHGHSVILQRAQHRNDFINRLKALRIKDVDKFRDLSEENLDYCFLIDLQQTLLLNKDELQADELEKILEDVQKELLIYEAEKHEQEVAQEAEAIANNLMDRCNICDNLIMQGDICQSCLNDHFHSP